MLEVARPGNMLFLGDVGDKVASQGDMLFLDTYVCMLLQMTACRQLECLVTASSACNCTHAQ